MSAFSWDRLGASLETAGATEVSTPENHQPTNPSQPKPLDNPERHPVHPFPARISEHLLWTRFHAKLDHCSKVVLASEACLPQSGLSEVTIHRAEQQREKERKVDGKAATMRDRVKRVEGMSIDAGKSVTPVSADDEGNEVKTVDKRRMTALAMREGIMQIKRADSVKRGSAFWQAK